MRRLVVASNRVAAGDRPRGDTGGLAVALRGALEAHGGVWFGWSGEIGPGRRERVVETPRATFVTVDLLRREYDDYYDGFANQALWPVLHYRPDNANFRRGHYAGYRRVNAMFARRLARRLRPDDLVWVHDYHLIPLGAELRRAGAEGKIGFFLHTPFPALEAFAVLPPHRELARDLSAYDVVGLQTAADLRAFLEYVRFEAGGEASEDGRARAFGRAFRAAAFPIGIDAAAMAHAARRFAQGPVARGLRRHGGASSWIVGVDRLDYSKGIPERFDAFEALLEAYPAYRGRVRFLQITPPSRVGVAEYRAIRAELEARAGHINGRFAEVDWAPLNYLVKSYAQSSLLGLYRAARVGLVTPLRDGMNLVAKEYVASQNPRDPGALVLSRFAGAARELSAALLVNPFDVQGVAEAVARALDMPLEERVERWRAAMDALEANTLDTWRDGFLRALDAAPAAPA